MKTEQQLKHSPAPWKSHPIENSQGLPYVPVTAETLIARVYSNHFGDDEQAAANGRLIAAAPELLASLLALLYRHNDVSDMHGPWAEWDDARDVISKVTSLPMHVCVSGNRDAEGKVCGACAADDATSLLASKPASDETDQHRRFDQWALETKRAYRNEHGFWFYPKHDGGEELWQGWCGRNAVTRQYASAWPAEPEPAVRVYDMIPPSAADWCSQPPVLCAFSRDWAIGWDACRNWVESQVRPAQTVGARKP
jgi:hypothetical protein